MELVDQGHISVIFECYHAEAPMIMAKSRINQNLSSFTSPYGINHAVSVLCELEIANTLSRSYTSLTNTTLSMKPNDVCIQ